jgi:pimeloyl-ACP methyl ester carboxylesterase
MENVVFKSKTGQQLHGIIHMPDGIAMPGSAKGIIILNPGIKSRVAPHRFNVKLARILCNLGYPVFRFDPVGIGDSEGELPENIQVADLWGIVSEGRFVADTTDAVTFFKQRCNLRSVCLIGSCGGAITAMLAGGIDDRIDGLCLIDIPIYRWDSTKTIADTLVVGSERSNQIFLSYIKKLMNFSTWYKLVTLQADFCTAWRIVKLKFSGLLPIMKPIFTDNDIEVLCNNNQLNYRFFKSIDAAVHRNVTMLFITAANDPGRDMFERFFVKTFWEHHPARKQTGSRCDFMVVDHANHIYSMTEWQQIVYSRISNWVGINKGLMAGNMRES